MKTFQILTLFSIFAFPALGYSQQESRILSESPDGKYVVHDDNLLPEFLEPKTEEESSGIFLVEKASGKRVMELPSTRNRNPLLAWTADSNYIAVAEGTRASYMECYHKLKNGAWNKCETGDAELPNLLNNMHVGIYALAFDRSGNLCLLLSIPNEKDYDPVEMRSHFCDVKIFRYTVSQDKLKLLDRISMENLVPMNERTEKMREIIQKYEGGIIPFKICDGIQRFPLYKKMDAKYNMGYYITDAIGNLNLLKIADAIPGADTRIITPNNLKGDVPLYAMLAPIKEGFKPQLYLIKAPHGKVQCANLKNELVTGYVETAKAMCFDENNKLYLYCEKDDVIGKVALTFVRISWEGGIRAEVISQKIVATEKKQKTFIQMERDTHNYTTNPHPLNLDFNFNGIQDGHK